MTFFQRNAYDFGCGIAALIWPFFRRRRKISIENLLRCGVAKDVREARRIAKRAFCHFAGHMCEAIVVPHVITRENWREYFDFSEADPEVEKVLFEQPDTPILLVSGHHGCWEAATNIISMNRPMIAIARVMDSKLLQGWMKKHHFRGPVTIIDKNNGMNRAILNQWQKEKSALTILMDQYAHNGAKLTFLGRPAPTVTSAARLAIKFGYPVVVGSFVRVGPCHYRAVARQPLVVASNADCNEVTQILNDRLAEAIRKYPEQYLWMHRRWRDE